MLNSLLLGLEEERKCLHTDAPLCTIYCYTPVTFGLLVRNITSVGCGNKFCTRELQYVDLSFFFWFRLSGSALGWQFQLFTLPINVHSLDKLQKAVDSILMSCCVFVSYIGHLLLTSCPTLRAEEEDEVEDEEEAWWRGLCLWGIWSRLGWEDAGPLWPCCWTHKQAESDTELMQ